MIWRVIWTRIYRDTPDFVTYMSKIAIVSGFELWMGIIVANIPTLAPIFKRTKFSKSSNQYYDKYYASNSSNSSKHQSFGSWRHSRFSKRGSNALDTTIGGTRTYGSEDGLANSPQVPPAAAISQHRSSDEEDWPMSGSPRNGEAMVSAECSYDPQAKKADPPPANDGIYVKTEIEV